MTNHIQIKESLSVFYDRPVDVLHVRLRDGVPYEGDGRDFGVELDYALADDKPVGAKVIGYARYGWDHNLNELAKILAEHLSVSKTDLAGAIKRTCLC